MLNARAAVPLTCLFAFVASTTVAAEYRAPRTEDGQPDLQGVWTNSTLTPLERPTSLGHKLVLTKQEARVMELAIAKRLAAADAPSDPACAE